MSDGSARVLYIDDDEGLRRLVARGLARRGFEVTAAENGSVGLELARTGGFDLVALDHFLPGEDGLEILAALQTLPEPPPVVYVTGSEDSRVAVAALKAGAVDYVVKSIGDDLFDLLASTFRQAIDQVRLRHGKEQAERELRASHERLAALLREVNHRVANSLQLVSAMVAMQARQAGAPEAVAVLQDTQRRIAAIGQVHRRLYTSNDVESVDMADYLAALVDELESTWSTPDAPRRVRLESEPVRLQTDKAVSVGVIVNELVSNACKYAYGAAAAGEVRLSLTHEGPERFRLVVEDDGPGLSKSSTPRGTGLGSRLIAAMADSLGTELVYDPTHKGVRAVLSAAA